MPTLTQRINTLTAAIATAINNRTISPASGYDIARLNGYTGTQAQWLADFSDPGNTDYATQFNNQLGTLPTAGIATEAQVGTTQLVTLAEALAGVNSAKALSALRHANIHVATNLADLNSKAAALPPGSLVAMAQQDYSAASNGFLYRSIWFIDHLQRATTIAPLITDIVATLTYITSVCGSGKTYTNILLDRGVIEALVGTSTSTGFRVPYYYTGTAWLVRNDGRTAAMAYLASQQAYPNTTGVPVSTTNVVSDPTGIMAPQAGDGSTWTMPWVGKYRMTLHMCLTANIAAGTYYGISAYIPNSISLADVGMRQAQNGYDAFEIPTVFFNQTANRKVACNFYHQQGSTLYTGTSSGSYGIDDPKTPRVMLEYLGA